MQIKHSNRTCASPAIAAAVALALSLSAASTAQAAAETARGEPALGSLEEIIVTGTKRDVSSQDVPISISPISAADLRTARVNDVRALQNLAPGLVLSNPAGFNATGGGMRGTGTNIILVTQDAPVSFLMDEFVLSHVSSQFITLFDTQQIEVYRGPQGTLFGKNTTGGVISITSKKPILGEYSGETQLTYGQYANGAPASSVQAAINLPLTDTLAMRIAAIYDNDAGFYTDAKHTSTFPNNVPLWGAFGIPAGTPIPSEINTNTTGPGGRLGGKSVLASKVKLLWKPVDWYSAYLIGEFVQDRSDSPPGVNESVSSDLLTLLGFPGYNLAGQKDPFSTLISHNANIQMDQGHRVDTQGVYLNQSFQVPGGEIRSITGYREQSQIFPSTYTGESFLTLFDSTRNTQRFTTQQELRFVSQFEGPFNFVAGGDYFHDSFNEQVMFSVGLTSLIPNFDPATDSFVRADGRVNLDTRALFDYQFQGTNQDRDEYAFYVDGAYDLTSSFTLHGGLRYSKDKKDFLRYVDGGGPCTALTDPLDIKIVNGACTDTRSQYTSRAGILPSQWNGRDMPLPLSAFGHVVDASNDWAKTTYRVVLDYKPGDDIGMFYLSYATGFLSGGYSETCATISRCAYDPETNQNLELGYKADLLDKTLRLNAALYYTKYDNLQRAVVAAYTAADGTAQQETVTVNTGSSKATGVDLEATWVPTAEWKVRGAVNWLHHVYGSGSVLPDLRGSNEPIDLTQFDLPFSPEWKAALDVSRDFAMPTGGRLTVNVNGNYQSLAETDVFNGVNTQMTARTLLGAWVTYYDPDSRWSATLYGNNLTNEIYRVAALPVAGLWNFTSYGAPRQIGVSVDLNFK